MNNLIGLEKNPIPGGFIRVVDIMGNDAAIVQAARISYGTGTKTKSEDKALIRYLMRNKHTTPFEMVEIKFHIKIPMDSWRQFVRHRTFNINEYSTRYSIAIDDAYKTDPEEWRKQSKNNKQGSENYFPKWKGEKFSQKEKEVLSYLKTIYDERIVEGVAREQARKDLPLSTFTEAYIKNDLHNLLHFLELRMDSHAQWEIRQYANAIGEIVKLWCPFTWQAFKDYRLNSSTFTISELKALRKYFINDARWDSELKSLSKRELNEFVYKLSKI